jgi:N-acyl-D-aspartate/D-glutamate deacylase
MHDLVIRGGFVVDGTGAPGRAADIAIDGDRIVAVGVVEAGGRREIDATGRLITPGWVDMHTHYDGQITWDPHLTPSGWHGVTTVVMGNCGVGFAPCRVEDRDWLINVMEGVEDIPGSALSEGIQWDWESFPEYMDAIEGMPHSLDFAAQVPHSALRGYVMGRRPSENENVASVEQIAEMKRLVKEALEAGALGFSTSRTTLHKTAEGVFVAGTFAEREELFGIAEALAETGKGVFEIADEHVMLPQDIEWLEQIAHQAKRPIIFNLSQTDFAPELWKEGVAKLEEAVERGASLWAQSAGRAIGVVMNWRTTAHPFALHPEWQKLSTLPWREHLAALRDPQVRARILADTPEQRGVFEHYITQSFDKMYPLAAGYEPAPEQCIAALAAAEGRTPAEVAYDALLEDNGEGALYFPLFNYTEKNLDILHTMHSHPRILMGLSDGGAHCGAICDSGMPTFMITHWTRDRSRGERFPLEYMVMRQTSQTAAFYGLHDRGILAPGYKADVNVIDYENLQLQPVELVFDLPAGGRRLTQRAVGYDYTICSGVVTVESGTPTGEMPGALVRGEQQAPDGLERAVPRQTPRSVPSRVASLSAK